MKLQRTQLASAIFLALGSLALSSQALAEEQRISTLVVTASGFEQDVTQAPASITVITREELQSKQVTSLADALSGIQGVDVRPLDARSGKTGNQTIQLRGLPSEYTLVLIDGVRQNALGTVAPNAFGDSASVFIPPIAAIERIEIIRGPMSTLYGSDALGGVVNIITRKSSNEWTGSLSQSKTFHSDAQFGGTSTAEGYVSGPLIENTLNFSAYTRLSERAESRVLIPGIDYDNNARMTDTRTMGQSPVGAKAETLGARLSYQVTADHELVLGADIARQTYNNDRGQMGRIRKDSNGNYRDGYTKELGFERDQFSLAHIGQLGFGQLESRLTLDRMETTGRTINEGALDASKNGAARKLELNTTIFDTKLVSQMGDHVLTVGGQYLDPKLEDGLADGRTIGSNQFSIFVEDEWWARPNLAITGGVRYDNNETFGSQISPRLYSVYSLHEDWTVKGGFGRGFRAPYLEQMEDGIIGYGNGGTTALFGNPDLKPEISNNFELGVIFDNGNDLTAQATVFFTQLKDKIQAATGAGTGTDNIGEAEVKGLELAASYHFMNDFTLAANYTWIDSEVTKEGTAASQVGDPLVSTPEHMLNLRLAWQATEQLNTYIGAEYRSDAFRPRNFHEPQNGGSSQGAYDALGDFKGYTLMHLGAGYQINRNVSVNGRIDNLLDKDFVDYKPYTRTDNSQTAYSNTYSSILPGRSLWVSVNVDF